jgi:type I restriction enzyme S subunit
VNPDKVYRLLGVRLEGKGPFIREEKRGSQIRANALRRVNSGDFIYSRLFAWRGAFGIIPPHMDGAYVSNEFPSFIIDKAKVCGRFLELFFSQRWVWNEVKAKCTGATKASRNRFKESFFLDFEVALPSLDEQRRIVAKIDRFSIKAREAKTLRAEVMRGTKALQLAAKAEVYAKVSRDGCMIKKLADVAPINMGQSPPGASYNKWGDGVPLLNGPTEFGERHPTTVQWTVTPTKLCRQGDILICVRGATTGRMNWADKEYCIGRGIAALTPRLELCIPEYLYYFIETQTQQILALTGGSTFPNLPGAKLKRLEIPIPPLATQRRIVIYLNFLQKKEEELRRLEDETERDMDELIPSILDKAFKGEL